MKTVFRIFLRDLKRLSRNRAAALVMVGGLSPAVFVCLVQYCGEYGSVRQYSRDQGRHRQLRQRREL